MGNTVARRSNSKNEVSVPPATPRREVATARKQRRRDDADAADEGDTTTTRAWRPRAGGALRAGGGDGAGAPAGKVVTVRVLMRRKDAEALAARLNARERKVRMAELKSELRGGGGMSPAAPPCRGRDACWSRRLEPIKES